MENSSSNGYMLKLGTFEGPLDLLFHLIEKNKINIYDIAIAELTDQYMDYLFAMQELDMELASEFLVMAATLLHIKSKTLLPDKRKEDEEEEVDPREELVRRLIVYKKYKDLASKFALREKEWNRLHYKMPEVYHFEKRIYIEEMNPSDLPDTYFNVLKRNAAKINRTVKKRIDTIISIEKVSLRSKIREVVRVLFEKVVFRFSELFNLKKQSKAEVVTGFLAILELAKIRKVKLKQEKSYGDITVSRLNNAQPIDFEEVSAALDDEGDYY